MARRFAGDTLVIASHNPGKVSEIADLLKDRVGRFPSAADLDLPEPEETGVTFVENAVLKAKAAAEASGLPALADDSGLSVTALGGAPGLYSARWAVTPDGRRDFAHAMERVRRELIEAVGVHGDHSASFLCALAIVWPEGDAEAVVGRVDGKLVFPPRGLSGFGYDPIFLPDGHRLTFGEMEPGAKHAISHRADAFNKIRDLCFGAAG